MFPLSFGAIAPRPTALADFKLYDLPTYRHVGDALNDYQGDDHIYALYPRVIAQAAQLFLNQFPGDVLYAVKANAHPAVLQTLWDAGLRRFDVASLRELELVHGLFDDAKQYVMHPVKSRRLIARAYALGVRDFVVDCEDELIKILDETNHAPDLALHVRLHIENSSADMPLDSKFGVLQKDAPTLLKKARAAAAQLGVCFHVGSQCRAPQDYRAAIAKTAQLIKVADVRLDSIDVGGGFPVAYPGREVPPMQAFFDEIGAAISENGFGNCAVLGEPGRALVAQGGSSLVRVELRKGNDLYINDGTYGSLFDAGQCGWKYPVRRLSNSQGLDEAHTEEFRFFGPSCDSLDAMAGPFLLPADMREGDWIEVQHLGAYGQALATRFNGFASDHTVIVLERD